MSGWRAAHELKATHVRLTRQLKGSAGAITTRPPGRAHVNLMSLQANPFGSLGPGPASRSIYVVGCWVGNQAYAFADEPFELADERLKPALLGLLVSHSL